MENLLLFFFFFTNIAICEEKILSAPLINLDQIQPSFEVSDDDNESYSTNSIKEKKNNKINSHAVLIGLDR